MSDALAASPPHRVLRANKDFAWPGGKRVAVVFNIAYEAWSDGVAPPIGPMGNVLKPGYFDTNAHSWASFGAVRGIHRLLRIADANKLRTSIMTSGILAAKHPETVAAFVRGGHEVIGHSWAMDVIHLYLDEAGERANIERNTQAVLAACGVKPSGWISPRGTGSFLSTHLLAQAGYTHHGDCNDDDLPAITQFDDGQRIVNIPLTMDINDLPHSNRYGNLPEGLVDAFGMQIEQSAIADAAPFMLDATVHCHAYGRANGAWTFDAMMKIARSRKDVWIATRDEIAQHTLNNPAMFA